MNKQDILDRINELNCKMNDLTEKLNSLDTKLKIISEDIEQVGSNIIYYINKNNDKNHS